ncbi:MAG: PAS domain S-box protein [Myxococcota bacterium]
MAIKVDREPSGASRPAVVVTEPTAALRDELIPLMGELADQARADRSEGPSVTILGPTVPDDEITTALPSSQLLVVLAAPDNPVRVVRALALGAVEAMVYYGPGSLPELRLRVQRAVDRARTARQLELERRDLAALLELSHTLSDTGDIEGTLYHIARQVAEVMGSERCSIMLLDDHATSAFVVAASDDPKIGGHELSVAHYPEIAEVLRTKEPLIIDDVSRAPLFDAVRERIRGKPVGSTVLFPVVQGDKVVGVIHVRGAAVRARFLSPHQLQFATIVTNVTAIAIRNARLYQYVRDRAERSATARDRAERRIRQLENYQRFFDLAGDGLVIVDVKGRFLFANREAVSILGFNSNDVTQLGLFDIVEPRGKQVLQELLEGFRQGHHRRRVDLPVLRANGESAILSLSTASLDPDSEDPAAIISFRDVTPNRQMEDELRKTKDFLEKVIESSADAVVAADMKGTILIFNSVAERITGYRRDEVVGKMSVENLYAPGVGRDIMRRLRAPEFGGVGRYLSTREDLAIHDGSQVPISLAAALLYDNGKEIASVGVFSDLRERLRMEAELDRAQRKLEMSERQAAIVELAGAAAHELSQPLTSILGSAELMARKIPADSPASAQLVRILRECDRMAEIVKNIGRITKYETKPYVGLTNIVDLSASSKDEKNR